MRTSTPQRARRLHRAAAGVALVATLAIVAAACDVPAQPAGDLFNAWKNNDHTAAAAVATPAAVTQMFSQAYSSHSGWFFNECQGAAGSTYCNWISKQEGELLIRIDNMSNKDVSVHRYPIGSITAGDVFHDWRVGNKSAALAKGTSAAVNALFAKTYKATDHWTPESCSGAAGSIYCTWTNDAAKTIRLQVSDVVSPPQFVGVGGTY